jgi:hypothetical protein
VRGCEWQEQWVRVRASCPGFSMFAGVHCQDGWWGGVRFGAALGSLRLSYIISWLILKNLWHEEDLTLHGRGRTESHTLVLVVTHIMQTHWRVSWLCPGMSRTPWICKWRLRAQVKFVYFCEIYIWGNFCGFLSYTGFEDHQVAFRVSRMKSGQEVGTPGQHWALMVNREYY